MIDRELSHREIILCNYEGQQKDLINTIILIFKQYIYASKCKQSPPQFLAALTNVVDYQRIEYRIALKTKKVQNHKRKWNAFIDNE